MLEKLQRHKGRIVIFTFLTALLILVRAYEDFLFYDPFLKYFKSDYSNAPLPGFDGYNLFGHLLFRYCLNTIVSLAIIQTLFREWELIKFSAMLYFIFFVVLITAFFIILNMDQENKLMLFYVRRFLIQPLFLLLFIPAFYFQKRAEAKNNTL